MKTTNFSTGSDPERGREAPYFIKQHIEKQKWQFLSGSGDHGLQKVKNKYILNSSI